MAEQIELPSWDTLDSLTDTDPLELRNEAWRMRLEVDRLRAEVDRLRAQVDLMGSYLQRESHAAIDAALAAREAAE